MLPTVFSPVSRYPAALRSTLVERRPSPFCLQVEYCWGDAQTTSWGQRRAADGHPQPYNITVFELGNEQYNPNYVQQVRRLK